MDNYPTPSKRPDDWTQRAACRWTDPELFFPRSTVNDKRQTRQALAVCAWCTVTDQCQARGDEEEAGLPDDEIHGVRGHETPQERIDRRHKEQR